MLNFLPCALWFLLITFSNLGASAVPEDVAAPAVLSPTSAGAALCVPAALAVLASLVSYVF